MDNSLQRKEGKKPILFVLYSLFGIFMFFIQVPFMGRTTIPIDHIVKLIQTIPNFTPVFGTIIVSLGGIYPFYNKTWNKSVVNTIFAILGLMGVVFVCMTVFNIGPDILLDKDMMPYVFKSVVVPVAAIVPVGSVFLAFLVVFGLMEFVGHFMRPVMRPLFKTPGRSSIDAVASFVGSYSLALLVTNNVYKQGKYTAKEACIIASGFSTVSATFMIITANTLDILDYWSIYFFITMVVTFVVTALTAYLYPLRSKLDTTYNNVPYEAESEEKVSFKMAWYLAMDAFEKAPGLFASVKKDFIDGIKLSMSIAPNIMSIGVIALLLANYSPIFDIFGYIFYPLAALLQIPDALLFSKGVAVSLADMYVPAIILKDSAITTRFITAIICISEILFFSASIPCVLSTEIPLSVKDIIIIWFERIVLTIVIATPIVHLISYLNII